MFKIYFVMILVSIIIALSCKHKVEYIEERDINSYIQNYFNRETNKLDYERFNKESAGINRIICINPNLDSLEFFLIDSSENNISYYKNSMEKMYVIKREIPQ